MLAGFLGLFDNVHRGQYRSLADVIGLFEAITSGLLQGQDSDSPATSVQVKHLMSFSDTNLMEQPGHHTNCNI